MKRTILFTTFIFMVLFSDLAVAQETNPCQNAETRRNVNLSALGFVSDDLQETFEGRLPDGIRCLLFNGILQVSGQNSLVFDVARSFGAGTIQDVYIDSINLMRNGNSDLPLLTITNNTQSRVIINNLQLSNVRNGLKLQDTGPIEVRGSTITGAGTGIGACLDVQSSGAVVRSSAISNCGEGVRIAASNVFLGAENPSAYETDKNTLIGNTIGIHQTSGAGNKWPFNSVSGGNGIVVDGGVRPVMRLAEGNLATLECTQPEGETAVAACEIQFDSLPETSGEVEVYKTIIGLPVESQGKDYIARCGVEEMNKCVFDAANAAAIISNIYCGINDRCDFTALQTGAKSSMYPYQPFELSETISTIIMPTGEGPIGGTAGADGGGVSGGETGDGPPEGTGLYIEGTDTGTLLVTEQPGGGGTVQQQAGSLPISVKACRFASADDARARGIFEAWWWVIFVSLPLLLVRRGRQNG